MGRGSVVHTGVQTGHRPSPPAYAVVVKGVNSGRHLRERRRDARAPFRLALTAVKGTALGALLSLVVVGGLQAVSPSGSTGTESVDEAYQRVVERAVLDHRCAYEGFSNDEQAASALIRTGRGDVRVVSFEKGWDVYSGKRPGHLIAVCLDDRETAMHHVLRVRQRVKS